MFGFSQNMIVAAKPTPDGSGLYLCLNIHGSYAILHGILSEIMTTWGGAYQKNRLDIKVGFHWTTIGIFSKEDIKEKYGFNDQDFRQEQRQISQSPLQIENKNIK